jgi:hypothetical protein
MNKGSNLLLSLPPLSGEDKGGVSFILSPSQGENQRGGFLWNAVMASASS